MLAGDVETAKKRQREYSSILTFFAMQYVYKKADIITAQTRQQSDIFRKDRKRKPDAVIKNVYSIENIAKINLSRKNTILWVGRLTKIKNPELFLNLAKKFPDEQFVMIAPVVKDYIDYGNQTQEKAKKIKNIKLVNYVKPTEIDEYYKNAKIYILTSDFEGFSNTMAEAMIAKCPILSYNVNPDDILNKDKCGFCADKDIKRLHADFEILINDSELRMQLGKNGLNYIKENHQKNKIIDEFKKLL